MEPDRQIEIQLGYKCGADCIFSVSGQRVARRKAGPTAVEPIRVAIRRAREPARPEISLLEAELTS